MKHIKIRYIIIICLLSLVQACQKDKPIPFVPEKYCWEIENWAGLLSDSLLLTDEEPLIPNVDTAFVKWLENKNNRIDIRSLTSENFDDLKCLNQYLEGKSLVQLGESSHGVKEYSQIKVRLIKYLHEELGFDVIAFESGLFECFYTYENINDYSAYQAIKNSIFGIWHTEDLIELFEYIKQTQSTDHPLILSGFDCQKSGSNYYKRSFLLFNMILKLDTLYAEEVYGMDLITLNNWNNQEYLSANKDTLIYRYQELVYFIDQNIDELISYYPDKKYYPGFIKQSLTSTIAFIREMYAQFENNHDEVMYVRDSAMAANITYLKEDLFPEQKIIIWAHNYHIAHDPDQKQWYSSARNMGNWYYEKYRDELYTIGLYMLRGKHNNNQGWGIDIVDVELPTTSYSLESILYHVRKKYLFIDLLNHPYEEGNKWMYYNITAKEDGIADEGMIMKEEYDGIIFIDTSTVPDYLN